MTVPVWKLTRTPLGRRVFDGLANRGVVLTRLAQYERELESPLPDPQPPAGMNLRIDAPEAVPLTDRMDRPELTDRDRVVAAVAGDRVVGVQPVTIDRPFYVSPLERTIDFTGAYFWGLYVEPEWRNRGVATSLVTRALSFVDDRTSQTPVQSLVGIDNTPSKRVLTGAGFERRGTRSYYRLFGLAYRGS